MSGDQFHGYVSVQNRGTIALPQDLRKRLHLDEPGSQIEFTERSDGVIEMRAVLPVPASQKWFWDSRWQVGELEVDAHVRAGEVVTHDGDEALLAHLDALDAE